jgi:hypothetical protein
MSYQQSSGTPRGFDRPKKAKAKKAKTQRTSGSRREASGTQTRKEVVDRAITALETLGSQTFAMAPFNQHFDRWLKSLGSVLDDFEASKVVELDDKFREERAELLTAVEAALKAEQTKEASRETTIMGLHGSKDLLFHAEQEHDEKLREQATRRDAKLKELNTSIDALRTKLDEVLESKAGFLERFTKSKVKLEEDARSRLAAAEKELDTAKASFAEELASLQGEYERERAVILEKVAAERREVDRLVAEAEVDGSVEVRRVACEELAGAVKGLVKRLETPAPQKTGDD